MYKYLSLSGLALFLLSLLAPVPSLAAPATADEIVARGEYLTRAGNCTGCHTARGGEPFAGGRRLGSAFGTFLTPNITPDRETGIGDWTPDQFWQALHLGRRPDGQALYPACPYPNFTRVRREDVYAIYAYLRTVPAVKRANAEHELNFPASWRPLMSIWQRWYFEPGTYEDDPSRDAAWNRGAYLVQGLGHCMACHVKRNRFGATLQGDDVPGDRVQGWYAPSLYSSREAGLQGWSSEESVALLRHGKARNAAVLGPMADTVYNSLQYLTEEDIAAMATYLQSLPDRQVAASVSQVPVAPTRLEAMMELGYRVYERSCQDCHGASGEGSVAASALAGNRAVTLNDPVNVIHMIRHGGYPPSTGGNPRPFGMPPFYELSSAEIAAVATFIRMSWGNEGTPVSTVTVERARAQ